MRIYYKEIPRNQERLYKKIMDSYSSIESLLSCASWYTKEDRKAQVIKIKPARVVSISLEDANPLIKSTMEKLGKTSLRSDQKIAHYKTEKVEWQVIVDEDIFVLLKEFQGNLKRDPDSTIKHDNDSLHLLVMGRSRGIFL